MGLEEKKGRGQGDRFKNLSSKFKKSLLLLG
jgi:hypothetical protein